MRLFINRIGLMLANRHKLPFANSQNKLDFRKLKKFKISFLTLSFINFTNEIVKGGVGS